GGVDAPRAAEAARALGPARAQGRRWPVAPGTARGPRSLAGRGRGGRRGRDRGRLWRAQGARPVRRPARADREAAALSVRGPEPDRRTSRARRGSGAVPAVDRDPREHALDPVRLGPLAPAAPDGASRTVD